MIKMHQLLLKNVTQTAFFGFRADPPTVTSQRLKGTFLVFIIVYFIMYDKIDVLIFYFLFLIIYLFHLFIYLFIFFIFIFTFIFIFDALFFQFFLIDLFMYPSIYFVV